MKKTLNTLRNYIKNFVKRYFKTKKTMIGNNKINNLTTALNELINECKELEDNPGNASADLLRECVIMPPFCEQLLTRLEKLQELNNSTTKGKLQPATTASKGQKEKDQTKETTIGQKNNPISKNKTAPVNEKKKIINPNRKFVKTRENYIKKKK